jgi:acetolactate synthase-1/2/3 large subunit
MTGGELLIECLKAQGVRCIFGMPGSENIQIYDALLRFGNGCISHYQVRHEYAATKMADGYARSTGGIGVALTVPGPGASNASTGILEAFTDCVPVLLITGQCDSKWAGKDQSKMVHGLDQMAFFKPITKFCATVGSVEKIPAIIEKTFRIMRSGRPGPAMLEFPLDVITGFVKAEVPKRVARATDDKPEEDAVRAGAKILEKATMPLIIAGSNVIHSGAREILLHFVEKLNIPVCSTRCAKGVLPEAHPLALSNLNGFMGQKALEKADCILTIGARFTAMDSQYWAMELPRPHIQIDADSREIGREYPVDVGITGDLNLALTALEGQSNQNRKNWDPVLTKIHETFAAQPPLPLIADIRDALPPEGHLVVDAHALGYATFTEFPISEPATYAYPHIGCSLGYAFPAALGAKIAHPDKPVISFSGDGGFMMGAVELATAVKYKINVVAIVINDGAFSSIKGTQQKYCQGRLIDIDLHNPDFVQLARAFGAWAAKVDDLSDFKTVLRDALAADRPALIEVTMAHRQADLIENIGWLREDLLRNKKWE